MLVSEVLSLGLWKVTGRRGAFGHDKLARPRLCPPGLVMFTISTSSVIHSTWHGQLHKICSLISIGLFSMMSEVFGAKRDPCLYVSVPSIGEWGFPF